MTDQFTHLHVHTQYSFLDGMNRTEKLALKCKEYGMTHCAITDHGSCCGHIDAYKTFKKNGIQPILGSEVYFTPDRFKKDKDTPTYHLVLLPIDQKGLKDLYQMLYYANSEGFYKKPRVDRDLLKRFGGNLIVLQACLAGEIAQAIINNDPNVYTIASWWKDTFGERFFLELQPNGLDEQILVNEKFKEISQKLNIPLVGTFDAHYLDKDDAYYQHIHVANGYGCSLEKYKADTPKQLIENPTLFLATPEEAYKYFSIIPNGKEACENTNEIAKLIKGYDLEPSKKIFFPKLYREEVDTSKQLIETVEKKLQELFPGNKEYKERADYESATINKLGFQDYFLILEDVFNYARSNNIYTGYGRGSAAGSLVAYLLGLTRVDPIKEGLQFERFLNENRVSPPDIDSDFSQERRGEILSYLKKKYGVDHMAQIGTLAELKVKSMVNDICRTLEIPDDLQSKLKKLIPEEERGGQGEHKVTLEKVLAIKDVQNLVESSVDANHVFTIAKQIEGLFRQPGRHACGFVISPNPISNFLPLMRIGSKAESASVNEEEAGFEDTDLLVTQWEDKGVENTGLIKFDFLGLKTLDYLAETHKLLGHKPVINYKDPKVIDLFINKHSLGIFQLKESGITEYTSEIFSAAKKYYGDEVTDHIVDLLTYILAVYRPGPMDNGWHMDILSILKGEKEETYPIPEIKDVLKPTFGYMIYQEQVMKVFQILANYSLAEADLVRRCIDKDSYIYTDDGPIKISDFSIIKNSKYSKYNYTDCWASGIQDVYRISLLGYPDLYLTENHKVKVQDGWKEVKDLTKEDFIIQDNNKIFGTNALSKDAILLNIGILCEGYYKDKNRGPVFYNKDINRTKEFANALDKNWFSYHINNNVNNVQAVCCTSKLSPFLDIAPALSASKKLPEHYMRLNKESLSYVLALLFEYEGFYIKKTGTIGFSTTSLELYKQVQIILNLFDIRFSSCIKKSVSKSGISCEIGIGETTEIKKIFDIITINIPNSKFQSLVCPERNAANSSDLIPSFLFRKKFFEIKAKYGFNWNDLPSKFTSGNFFKGTGWKTKKKVQELVTFLVEHKWYKGELNELLTTVYAKVQSVKLFARNREVFDFSEQNFNEGAINGSLVHNCIGKKNRAELDAQKDIFLSRSIISKEQSEELWGQIEKFADYSFNKSHSCAYAYLSYETAFLKANYTEEFIAAGMTVDAHGAKAIENMGLWIKDAKSLGIKINPPHILNSDIGFKVLQDKSIQFGFNAIKGMPSNAIEAIVKQRQKDDTLNSLFTKVKGQVNTKAVKCLIDSGALDSFGYTRAGLRTVIDDLASKKADKKKLEEEINVFVPDIKSNILEDCKLEKDVLGMFLSAHPLDKFKEDSSATELLSWPERYDGVNTLGVLTEFEIKTSKAGKKFCAGQFSNLGTDYRLVIFPRETAKFGSDLDKLVVGGIYRFYGSIKEETTFIVSAFEQVEDRDPYAVILDLPKTLDLLKVFYKDLFKIFDPYGYDLLLKTDSSLMHTSYKVNKAEILNKLVQGQFKFLYR